MTSSPVPKRARTTASSDPSPPFTLIYWPTLPGRGEPIRLCFEATQTPYTDLTNKSPKDGMPLLKSLISSSTTSYDPKQATHLAPPILQHGDLTISQLPNILLYLGPKLGLVPDEMDDPNGVYHVNQLALTALDGFLIEAHDTHHPIGIGLYYEDQKEPAAARSKDYLANRLPKFLTYFENVLTSDASKGGEYLYGGELTYADLALWQGLDGVGFAFPRRVKSLKEGGQFSKVWAMYDRIKAMDSVKEYLASGRRQKYGNGIWRRYAELDQD
ncbi:MAG: hypothetical protein Q9220_005783 [cf. Caloplaca sp. 1 TL-2023]